MRQMKDSGVEWIGEIPQDWNIIRLRFLCEIKTGNQDTQDRNPDGKYPFYVRSPIVEKCDNYSFDGSAILMAGDGVGAGKVFHIVDGKKVIKKYEKLHPYNISQKSEIIVETFLNTTRDKIGGRQEIW